MLGRHRSLCVSFGRLPRRSFMKIKRSLCSVSVHSFSGKTWKGLKDGGCEDTLLHYEPCTTVEHWYSTVRTVPVGTRHPPSRPLVLRTTTVGRRTWIRSTLAGGGLKTGTLDCRREVTDHGQPVDKAMNTSFRKDYLSSEKLL